jgi:putative transposase
VTIRRACAALHFDRSTYHYRSRRTDPAFLKKRIKEICETHFRNLTVRITQGEH